MQIVSCRSTVLSHTVRTAADRARRGLRADNANNSARDQQLHMKEVKIVHSDTRSAQSTGAEAVACHKTKTVLKTNVQMQDNVQYA